MKREYYSSPLVVYLFATQLYKDSLCSGVIHHLKNQTAKSVIASFFETT